MQRSAERAAGQRLEPRSVSRRDLLRGAALAGLPAAAGPAGSTPQRPAAIADGEIVLPGPRLDGAFAVERALQTRRSVRSFAAVPLTLQEVGQLLWAAQGITAARGLRTAPSAGATYPLQTFLVAGAVRDLPSAVYRYLPQEHRLRRLRDGDVRAPLAAAALGQQAVGRSAISIVLAAVYRRTTDRYGERGRRYVHMEVGHVGQNIHLQAAALGLGTVVIGAFDDDRVGSVVGLAADERALSIMPVGRR